MNAPTKPLALTVAEADDRARDLALAELRVLRNWKSYEVALLDDLGTRLKYKLVTPTMVQDWIADAYGTTADNRQERFLPDEMIQAPPLDAKERKHRAAVAQRVDTTLRGGCPQ